MDYWNIIGFTASVLSATTLIPEVIKAVRTRHLRDVAWGMLFLQFTSSWLWLIYGIRFYIGPLILSSSINVALSSALISLKLTFCKKNKKTEAVLETQKSSYPPPVSKDQNS
jgi:MtN3 and saliva related transmembrane protein